MSEVIGKGIGVKEWQQPEVLRDVVMDAMNHGEVAIATIPKINIGLIPGEPSLKPGCPIHNAAQKIFFCDVLALRQVQTIIPGDNGPMPFEIFLDPNLPFPQRKKVRPKQLPDLNKSFRLITTNQPFQNPKAL